MRILIIGGSGNISADFVRHLVDRGDEVAAITRGNAPLPEGCEHRPADRWDPDQLAEATRSNQPWDAVVDFMAFTPDDCALTRGALLDHTRQYVFISSATVYRKPHDVLPITEQTPTGNTFSEYARRKEASEHWLREHSDESFPVTIVRPSHTFCKSWIPAPIHGSNDYTIAARIEQGKPVPVHDDGMTLWTLTATTDFAVALAGLLGNPQAIDETIHITSDEPLTWNAIYQEIGYALNAEPRLVYMPTDWICGYDPNLEAGMRGDKSNHGLFDNTKIKHLVPEFQCRKPFRDAIREAVAWYAEDAERRLVDPERDAGIDAMLDAWQAARG